MVTSSLVSPENTIEIVRGSSRTIEVKITDLDGVAVDITGGRVIMALKEYIEDPDDQCKFIKDSNIVTEALITNGTGGIVRIFLVPSDTHNLTPGFDYVYDIWLVQASGDRFSVVGPSVFKVTESVTRIPLP